MIDAPPLDDGAVKATVNLAAPAVTVPIVGAPATDATVNGTEKRLTLPSPLAPPIFDALEVTSTTPDFVVGFQSSAATLLLPSALFPFDKADIKSVVADEVSYKNTSVFPLVSVFDRYSSFDW